MSAFARHLKWQDLAREVMIDEITLQLNVWNVDTSVMELYVYLLAMELENPSLACSMFHCEEADWHDPRDIGTNFFNSVLCRPSWHQQKHYFQTLGGILPHQSAPARPFVNCRYCACPFHSDWGRRRHERIHTGQTYICNTCCKVFPSSSMLECHCITHLSPDEKQRYKCRKCGKTFLKVCMKDLHAKTCTGY